MKALKDRNVEKKNLKLLRQWKCPQKIRVIIQQQNIILMARKAQNERCPNITMDNIKRHNSARMRRNK